MGLGTILVTGASGLLGANLVTEFASRGERVFAQYLEHPVHFTNATSLRCGVTDSDALQKLTAEIRPTWVIHCAAATNVDWCEQNASACFHINADGSRFVAEAAHEAGCRLIYVSTDAVFHGDRGGYAENDVPNPVNVYARSKLLGEKWAEKVSPGALIVRMNIFGINTQDKTSFAEQILQGLEMGSDVPGFYDVTFAPLLVNDVAHILLELMTGRREGVYHLGSRDHCSKYEFALHIARIFGFDTRLVRSISVDGIAFAALRPRQTWLRTGKAAHAIRREIPSVQEGIRRLKSLWDGGYREQLKAASRQLAGTRSVI